MNSATPGKISQRDRRLASLLNWAPWISFLALSLPVPAIFLVLFSMTSSSESAAIYLLLTLVSLGLGSLVGLLMVILLLIYRRRWLRQFRDRLAADGITADELRWFTSELTSAERETLREVANKNPVLADAYSETLASRLTATRIIGRARLEELKVERRINRARSITAADTASLLADLEADHERLKELRGEATVRLAEARAQLQMIEASASRTLNQAEIDLMLQRLTNSQEHLPLSVEMARLEEEALREVDVLARNEMRPDE